MPAGARLAAFMFFLAASSQARTIRARGSPSVRVAEVLLLDMRVICGVRGSGGGGDAGRWSSWVVVVVLVLVVLVVLVVVVVVTAAVAVAVAVVRVLRCSFDRCLVRSG